jgi:hypothetical protein
METEKFLETIRKLDSENRTSVLTYAMATYTAQENTKHQYDIPTPHGGGPGRPGEDGVGDGEESGLRALKKIGEIMEKKTLCIEYVV